MRKNESGRSMTEMLGMLAIAGILSASLIIGFDYAMSKIEAHRIYKDIKLAYISFFNQLTKQSVWQPISFDSYSNKQFFIQRDKGNHDFVRVATLTQKVCQSLLDHVQDTQEMTLFSLDGAPLTCHTQEQEIIASFSGVSPLVVCDTGADCPDVYNVYCDASAKECKNCPWTQRADDTHNKCVDLCQDRTDGYTQSCGSDEFQANWCCPANYMCSEQAGMCLDDTVCMYEVGAIGDFKYTTNCSYTINPIGDFKYTTNCSYMIGEDDVFKISDPCPDNFYCYINWLDETWDMGQSRTISGTHTGKAYGVCTEMGLSPSPIVVEPTGDFLTVENDTCPDNFYCYVNWLDETWDMGQSRTIPGTYTGKAYGVCTEMGLSPSAIVKEPEWSLSEKKGCADANKYCYLQWQDSAFKQQISSSFLAGSAYGVCILMSGVISQTPGSVEGITSFDDKSEKGSE